MEKLLAGVDEIGTTMGTEIPFRVGCPGVWAGMAWWYRQYAREQASDDRANYEQAVFNAKVRRLGLWADKDPVAP
jgi:endonuclease YncB( thermonuclease family)